MWFLLCGVGNWYVGTVLDSAEQYRILFHNDGEIRKLDRDHFEIVRGNYDRVFGSGGEPTFGLLHRI
jgi:hypothetical protein